MFHNFGLTGLVNSGPFVQGVLDLQLGAIAVPPFLIGDPAYLLLSWLMWLYTNHLDPRKTHNCWTKGYLTHYMLLLLIFMVLQEHLVWEPEL
ncbi:hypothetical protein Y1Q_0008551 [Alligator mississippiensis]|uniref:Uncharacterized protein n=1 Tax=Alligator mississippiensis TaxID=8496 RepID=A0A151M1S7_ALLMI|nr:hypothetical protein Y1Q_0008551 [Alligator mississippiensis]